MNQLDPAQMSGTAMAVTDVSRPAMEGMQRRWPNQGRGIDPIDMNREWPGNENGATAPSRHAGVLFNRLLRPNADFAIDFHTGMTGFKVTAFNLGHGCAEVKRRRSLSVRPGLRQPCISRVCCITRSWTWASRPLRRRSAPRACWTSK